MYLEKEIEHIIHSFEKEIEGIKEDMITESHDKNTYLYIKGHIAGQKSVISRLQIALDELRLQIAIDESRENKITE